MPTPGDQRRAVAVAALAVVGAALPVFLVGALAVQIRAALDFSQTALGIAITAFFTAAALTSVPGGRLADKFGARRCVRFGSAATGCALLLLASAPSWALVLVALVVAGSALGVTEPAVALVVSGRVRHERQGMAFGIKEAAIPAATMLAGAAVPAVGLTVGWRWAFAAAIVLVPALWLLLPPDAPAARFHGQGVPGAAPSRDVPALPLAVVSAGSAFGVAAVTAMSAFLVEAAVTAGLSPAGAGMLLAAGGLAGISGRLTAGWLADRLAGPQLPMVAVMMLGGAGGLGMLAFADLSAPWSTLPVFAVGTAVSFSIGWGWTGLLFLSAVRAAPAAPAAAVGTLLAGLSTGGAVGPLLFGWLVERQSFAVAWSAGAAGMLLGAALVLYGNFLVARRA